MNQQELTKAIKQGKIFIYPTDTIYGLGCDATNKEAVEKIKKIKARDRDKPLSVISPSIKWIKEHLIVDVELEKYLPGAYTLVLKKKNPEFLSWVSSGDSLGIRIPRHEFIKTIQKAGIPFITTSVNLSGEKPAINLSEISENIKNQADFIIKSQTKFSGKPSKLVINNKEVKRK